MDEFTGAVVLLVVVLAVVLAGIVRLTAHWREFSWKRHDKALLSRELPGIKSGDILLFISHATGLTNSLFMNDLYTHSGMVVMVDGVPHLSEATIAMPQLRPDGDEQVATPNAAVLVPLVPRLEYYAGSCFLMPLAHPLTPSQEAALASRAREKGAYPKVHHMLLALVGVSSGHKARQCMQHVAWLLDGMGTPPVSVAAKGEPFLKACGFFKSSRAITALSGGEALVGGNRYGEVVELLVDGRARPAKNAPEPPGS